MCLSVGQEGRAKFLSWMHVTSGRRKIVLSKKTLCDAISEQRESIQSYPSTRPTHTSPS
jgi:hypothetical protein